MFGCAGEGGRGCDGIARHRQRAVGARDDDAVIGGTEIAACPGDWGDCPLLVRPDHIIAKVDVDRPAWPVRLIFAKRLVRDGGDRRIRRSKEAAARIERDAGVVNGKLQRAAAALRFDLIRSGRKIFAADRPAIFPQQGLDREHATPAAIHIGFIVHRELLESVAKVDQAEMAGAVATPAPGDHQFPTAFQQRYAHMVDERAGRRARAPDANVVRRIGPVAARAVRSQQIVIAVAVEQCGGFHVDRDIDRLVACAPGTRCGIELDHADIAEIGAVAQPQPPVGEEEGGIDRIGVFDAVALGNDADIMISESGRAGVKRVRPHHLDLAGMAAVHAAAADRIGDIVAIADVDDVGRDPAAGTNATAMPAPAVFGHQATAPCAERIIFPVRQRDRRGIMDKGLALQLGSGGARQCEQGRQDGNRSVLHGISNGIARV